MFPRAYKQFFLLKILKIFYSDPDPGSGIFLTLYPGWKNLDPGSGINIPDPPNWSNFFFSFFFSNLIDEKPFVLGRRPTPSQAATEDEPFAWEAREFLRQLTVGKHVLGHVVHTANRKSADPVLANNPLLGGGGGGEGAVLRIWDRWPF